MRIGLIRQSEIVALLTFAFLFACPGLRAQYAYPAAPPQSAYSIPQAQLIQPEALAHILQTAGAVKPLMLQVGSHVLFAEGHIPGSEYVGPGSQPEGLQQLRLRVNSLPRKKLIVLYCGCCPWNHCPNVGPAYETLREMGFINAKVLYMPDNFGADWAAKGYPVAQGR
jgi:rhodanese-related sulfurtransferase